MKYNTTTIKILDWIGATAITASAVLVSISAFLSTQSWPFLGFLFGHIIWTATAYSNKKPALIFGNVLLIPFDILAIYIRL